MEDIDYSQKIATFNLLVGNINEEIALNYLTISNWDETKAAILYNKENKGAQAKLQRPLNLPNYDNNLLNPNIYNANTKTKSQSNSNNNKGHMPLSARGPQIRKELINNNYLAKLVKYKQCSIFKKNFLDHLKFFKKDNEDYFQQFNISCKYCVRLYDVFIKTLRGKVGAILLYNDKTYNNAVDFLEEIKKNDITQNILSSKTMIFPLISGSLEGDKIIKELHIKNFPCLIICVYKNENYFAIIDIINNIMQNIRQFNETLIEALELINDESNSNKNNKSIPPLKENKVKNNIKNNINNINIQNNNNIIDNTNNINIPNNNKNFNNKTTNNNNIISQNNNIISNNNINNNIINNDKNEINYINNNSNEDKGNKNQSILNDINNYLPEDINGLNRDSFSNNSDYGKRDSYSYMTDGEVLARQEQEMKSLEKMEENKRLEEEKREKEKKEEEEKKKEKELIEKIEAKSALEILPEEPNDDNPDKCVIVFRFPDGEKVVQRKFLKTDKITNLYIYIKSFGREIYGEDEGNNFSLIQPFPFKNFDELQENSLEKEGLFPNAVLQIKVIE